MAWLTWTIGAKHNPTCAVPTTNHVLGDGFGWRHTAKLSSILLLQHGQRNTLGGVYRQCRCWITCQCCISSNWTINAVMSSPSAWITWIDVPYWTGSFVRNPRRFCTIKSCWVLVVFSRSQTPTLHYPPYNYLSKWNDHRRYTGKQATRYIYR